MRKYEEALQDYTHAIELNNNIESFYFGRAWVYLKLGSYEDALADASRSIEVNPKNIETFVRRAQIFRVLGNEEAALGDLQKALQVECQTPGDYYDRATAVILSNCISEALTEFEISFTKRGSLVFYAQYDDLLNPIRDLSGFKELM